MQPDEPSRPANVDPLDHAQIDETSRRLEAVARTIIAKRGIPNRADLQPESVAHSVIAGALDAPPTANDHEHMLAILNAAVEHKIIDRLRRGGRRGAERSEADSGADLTGNAVARDAAPDETTLRAEDASGAAHFQAIASRSLDSASTWQLIELHLMRGRSLGEAAVVVGISRDAAKTRYHSAKAALLAALLKPVLNALPIDDATLGRAVLHDRLPVGDAAAALGIAEADARARLTETIVPALTAAYGRQGASAIAILAGRSRG